MKACRAASAVAFGALAVAAALGACGEAARPEVPPVTAARPTATTDPVLSGPASGASLATAPPAPIEAGAAPVAAREPPMKVTIADLPTKLAMSACTDAAVAVVDGRASALGETLHAGDAMLLRAGEPVELKGSGVVVTALAAAPPEACAAAKRPPREVVRLASTPELTWGRGAMRARLQIGEGQGSSFYLGRLEGSAPVGEHEHAGSWEILAAIDAAGTFVLDGEESRLGPREVVFVPPSSKHAWRPDPGSSLRAVQIYSPRGPEQRFVALAAAEDAGAAPGSTRPPGK